ncbi:MAG TPA: CAP domain-containing protein, partial [Longimicrobium sp.]|nr:CAP domain-containing protein [Longimicrobium sp.]
MRWLPGVAAAALLASCIVVEVPVDDGRRAADPPAAPPPVASAPGSGDRRLVEQMAGAVNAHRRSVRCPELVWMQAVANAAQGHSLDMARRNYFNHTSPEGLGPADRLRAHGVDYRAMGENIAQHPGTPREVLAGWLASPGHRQNLERCGYTHHGIGLR